MVAVALAAGISRLLSSDTTFSRPPHRASTIASDFYRGHGDDNDTATYAPHV